MLLAIAFQLTQYHYRKNYLQGSGIMTPPLSLMSCDTAAGNAVWLAAFWTTAIAGAHGFYLFRRDYGAFFSNAENKNKNDQWWIDWSCGTVMIFF